MEVGSELTLTITDNQNFGKSSLKLTTAIISDLSALRPLIFLTETTRPAQF